MFNRIRGSHIVLKKLPVRSALALACAFAIQGVAAQTIPVKDEAYPAGPINVAVDATNLQQRIMRISQDIPVQPGKLTLLYPAWLPGNHSPRGPIDKIAGIKFTANGKPLVWKRDPLDVFAFNLDVPAGVSNIKAEFQYLTPTDSGQGRVVMTPSMLNLQWNAVLLYPAGYAQSKILFNPSVKYPSGWGAGTALDVASKQGDTVTYKQVPLEVLADSPVYAGRHYKQILLSEPGQKPVRLNVVADEAKYLETKPEHIEQHKELLRQAKKLYASEHYDHYDFLLSLSTQMAGNGLEHQRSSENGQELGYFKDWDKKTGSDDLLPHEMTHSWNGKYRRPDGQMVGNFNTPLDDSLLWVYEGQTQYWGNVLAARSGLRPMDRSRDTLASVVAYYADGATGLDWRTVQDTTYDPVIAQRRPKPYRNYQLSEDYYSAGQLIWLGADALIRSKTGGKKSLDNFAAAFFGKNDGQWQTPLGYNFDEVVSTLNDVLPMDWGTWLRDRLEGRVSFAKTIEDAGWKLVYKDTPTDAAKAAAKESGRGDFVYSLGITTDKAGKVGDTRWDSPAFNAGIGTGMTLVAVNDIEYSAEVLNDAITEAKTSKRPIRLTVKDFNRFRTIELPYYEGKRYPHLEQIKGKTDYLTPIFSKK